MQQLSALELIEGSSLLCKLTEDWDYDDASALSHGILNLIDDVSIKEEIVGADRITIRFSSGETDLILHTEFYSQAIWIESALSKVEELKTLNKELSAYIGTFF